MILGLGASAATASTVATTGLKVLGLLLFVAIWLLQLTRVRNMETLLYSWLWVILSYLLLASGWYWPWYATWAVSLAALVAAFDIKDDARSQGDAGPFAFLSGIGTATLAALLLAAGSLTLYGFLPLYSTSAYGYRAIFALGPAVIC